MGPPGVTHAHVRASPSLDGACCKMFFLLPQLLNTRAHTHLLVHKLDLQSISISKIIRYYGCGTSARGFILETCSGEKWSRSQGSNFTSDGLHFSREALAPASVSTDDGDCQVGQPAEQQQSVGAKWAGQASFWPNE